MTSSIPPLTKITISFTKRKRLGTRCVSWLFLYQGSMHLGFYLDPTLSVASGMNIFLVSLWDINIIIDKLTTSNTDKKMIVEIELSLESKISFPKNLIETPKSLPAGKVKPRTKRFHIKAINSNQKASSRPPSLNLNIFQPARKNRMPITMRVESKIFGWVESKIGNKKVKICVTPITITRAEITRIIVFRVIDHYLHTKPTNLKRK